MFVMLHDVMFHIIASTTWLNVISHVWNAWD